LTFLFDPVAALRLTLLVFAAIGYAGFYRFQRQLFGICGRSRRSAPRCSCSTRASRRAC